jgi:hypothetical protein
MAFPGPDDGVAGDLRVVRESAGRAPRVRWEATSILARFARGVPHGVSADEGAEAMLWSGSSAEVDGGGAFDEDPRTWGPKGWAALEEAVRAMPGRGRVWVRPHARHVVSDIPGVRRLLEAEWGSRLGVALDPAAMMTPAMRGSAGMADLVTRVFEAVELLPPERLMVVVDAEALPAALLRGLVERCVPVGVPLVVRGEGWWA